MLSAMKTDGLGGPNPLPHHVLSLEQAEDRLQPYKVLLNECIHEGWKAWMEDYVPKHSILSSRSRAAVVFDEIRHRAQIVFGSMPDVKLIPHSNSFILYIGDDIMLRFKKLRRSGLCSNINTRQQMLFQAQMCLPGVLAGTLVHAGYLLDDLQREIIKTLVVCQFENQVLWTIKLTGEGGSLTIVPPIEPDGTLEPQWEFIGDKAAAAETKEEAVNNPKKA
jgi:hypothetical protein